MRIRALRSAVFDLGFRPATYFWPMTAERHILGRINGQARRDLARTQLALGFIDPEVATPKLRPRDASALSRIHPSLSSGEYLPALDKGEVEIARVVLVGAVLGDVTSLRARREGNQIGYRVVDEYQSEHLPGVKSSRRPLTLRALVFSLETCSPALGVGFLQQSLKCGADPEDLQNFMVVESLFYPQLRDYYGAAIDRFLAPHLPDQAVDELAEEA